MSPRPPVCTLVMMTRTIWCRDRGVQPGRSSGRSGRPVTDATGVSIATRRRADRC